MERDQSGMQGWWVKASSSGAEQGRERHALDERRLCIVQQTPPGTIPAPAEETANCARALLTAEPHPLPDHVCLPVMLATTELFAAQRFPLGAADLMTGVAGSVARFVWQRAWPLPMGKASLARFAAQTRLNIRHLPPPLIEADPDAEIGLWLERRLPSGTVRLLGPTIRDEHGRAGRFGTAYLEIAPAPKIYTEGVPANEPIPLHAVARSLGWWYQRHILGQAANGVGRPVGPRPDFEEREGRAYRDAAAELRRSRRKATVTAIATEMSVLLGYEVGRTTLQYWLKQGWVTTANEIPN